MPVLVPVPRGRHRPQPWQAAALVPGAGDAVGSPRAASVQLPIVTSYSTLNKLLRELSKACSENEPFVLCLMCVALWRAASPTGSGYRAMQTVVPGWEKLWDMEKLSRCLDPALPGKLLSVCNSFPLQFHSALN